MFREEFKRNIGIRIVDILGHITFMLILPGEWWFQLLPDMLLPIIWIRSMITNKLIPEDSPTLQWHKWNHSVYYPLIMMGTLLCLGVSQNSIFGVGCQLLSHIIWDHFTHVNTWDRKSLWKL